MLDHSCECPRRPQTTAEAPEDFIDLVRCLREEQCDFVVVGAHALAAHGVPRATGDLDIFVRPVDFAVPGNVYQMGLPPHRIDLIAEITGVSFDEAVREPVVGHLGAETVRCIGLDALIANKRATGRTKDRADVEVLEELRTRHGR